MAIAGVATELLGLTLWHMPAPMRAHAQAFSSSFAPAGPLSLWLSIPTHVPHRVRRAQRCHHARHNHRTTVPRTTHTLAVRHTLTVCARPVCCRLSLRSPCYRAPASRRLLSRPSSAVRPLSHAGRISALHRRPLALPATCFFLLLCAALPLVRCCAMPSTWPWTNVAEGLSIEYEEEVVEKVWRGKRSRVAPAGCGGGDYARSSRSGRRDHNWKESQKNHNRRSHSKKC